MDTVTALPWPLWVATLVGTAIVWGHAWRRIERFRFKVNLRLHGYDNHGEYVNGPEWKARRRRFLLEHGRRPPCWNCAKDFSPRWPVHHLFYGRAGGGQEKDRDLRFVCDRCHVHIHRRYKPTGIFRALGFSLRQATHLVRAAWLPVRFCRRRFGRRAATA